LSMPGWNLRLPGWQGGGMGKVEWARWEGDDVLGFCPVVSSMMWTGSRVTLDSVWRRQDQQQVLDTPGQDLEKKGRVQC
jgi:hypothetical protein